MNFKAFHMKTLRLKLYVILFLAIPFVSCQKDDRSVKDVMDAKISWLYKNMDQTEMSGLDNPKVMKLFTPGELEILATRHWVFDASVPVVVSVMRSVEQKDVPFWLAEKGFTLTALKMKNERTTYEVWQKKFKAGKVGLGINGFENYSLHYFVTVAAQDKNADLQLTNFFPANQFTGKLEDGAFTYHDWDELVLSDVPESMRGQVLLTTIRGRGTESQLIGVFRKTDYPSSDKPDQIMLTWSSDPATTVDVQWRTDTLVTAGSVIYRELNSTDESSVPAERLRMDDRVLMNDRYINRFTARIRDLKPGTSYEYRIAPQSDYDAQQVFTTAAPDSSFSFIWFGDTHHSAEFGKLIKAASKRHPGTAFYSIAGDIVSDGLYRNQWDDIFSYISGISSSKPFMLVPGNHDNRSGLGAKMYRDLFSYPENAPAGVEKEQTYSFTYKNALFLMIDATSPIDPQTVWIEQQLSQSKARWKFAMFHFPPYSSDGGYPELRQKWGPLFDKYHVDMVMSGHVHNYLRTKPMNGEKAVSSPALGTIYLVSIGIPDNAPQPELPFAAAQVSHDQLYQKVTISGGRLDYSSMNIDGFVKDKIVITK